ncbi:MAG: UDP-2,3-diacylglucosamine diphosphatase [Bacteroidales bacterium]|nr:UDP-2,3-diacylglucosamine diphosphatase [Bacteroidales bacterium]
MKTEKKIYFISDVHLGVDSEKTSLMRENMLIKWLDEIKNDAFEINFLGDIFDFWFEYKYLVPRNFVRFLTKIRELSDSGIIINFFTGNHDMWIFDYLPEICQLNLFRKPVTREIFGKVFFIGHGDGLGNYDKKYNLLKVFFASKICQFLFKTIHPSISFRIANTWSRNSRKKHKISKNFDIEKENLVKFAREELKKQHIDFFVFGHSHRPLQIKLEKDCVFTNTGDWLENFTYSVFDGECLVLKKF